jgi:hypothetical protein
MTGLTRGPLPAEVYWRRRLALLTGLVMAVLVIAKLIPGGGHEPKATTVAHVTSPSRGASSTSSTTPSPSATPTPTVTPSAAPTPTAPPSPTAVCSDDDISVAPTVADAQATKPVVITLAITSNTTPACLWDVSPATLQLKITSGSDRIWSTLDCPNAVPNQRVVVQRDVPTDINIRWNTRRSEAGCPPQTNWASLGYYHVTVAALGGQPEDEQFPLKKPTADPPSALPSAITTPGASTAPTTSASAPPAAPETAPVTTPAAPTSGAVPSRHLRKGLKAD